MFDMDEMRVPTGTVADFSGWNGVKADGRFKSMKITSSEKVIEPVEEDEEIVEKEQPIIKRKMEKATVPAPELNNEAVREIVSREEMPGIQQAYLNPNELKEIAIRLMPTVDKMPNYTKETIRAVSENAINIAFEFLQVWNEKVSVGE